MNNIFYSFILFVFSFLVSCQPVFVEPGDCEIIKIGNKTKDSIKVVEPPTNFLRIASITNSDGLIENYQYDNVGRIVRSNNLQAKTYKTYSYPTGKIEIKEFDSFNVNTITSKGILNSKGLLVNLEVYENAIFTFKKTYLYNDSMQVVKEVVLDVVANKEASTAWIYDEDGNIEEIETNNDGVKLSTSGFMYNPKPNFLKNELKGMGFLGEMYKDEAMYFGDLFEGTLEFYTYEYNDKGYVVKLINQKVFSTDNSWTLYTYNK
ncbi:MAG: hypothetical protein KA313_06035 [Pseudarcicella sp.]|nr:hypothetical protein [Pseudarcicella sp.]